MYTESWPSLSLTDSNDCPVLGFFSLFTPDAFAVLDILEVLLNVTDPECIPAMSICCWKEMVALGVEFLSKTAPTRALTAPEVGWRRADEAMPVADSTENRCRGWWKCARFSEVCLNNEPSHLCT